MIDGYAHCGLSKYRPVEDVLTVMQSAGVDRAVLCQHLGEYDNSYLASVVARHAATFAAVCLVDPASARAAADLEKWHATGQFRGVRLLADWLRDYESLWARAAELDLTLVIYAPSGMAVAAPTISRFATAHPSARIVVTHLGNPQLNSGRLVDTELLRLAARTGVFVQLSGLSQFCDHPHAELLDFIREIVREFGAPRIYWGSNFPVCGDAAAYRRDLQQVASGEWDLSPEQIHWITSQTAERLWFTALFLSPGGLMEKYPASHP